MIIQCPKCGKPWVRVVLVPKPFNRGRITQERNIGQQQRKSLPSRERDENGAGWVSPKVETIGWAAGCSCNAGKPIPCVVLDPFVGSGTSCIVAKSLGRKSIGMDLSEDYLRLAKARIESQQPALKGE